MRSPTYLFDTSSLFKALKQVRLRVLSEQAIQWITIYEALNAL